MDDYGGDDYPMVGRLKAGLSRRRWLENEYPLYDAGTPMKLTEFRGSQRVSAGRDFCIVAISIERKVLKPWTRH